MRKPAKIVGSVITGYITLVVVVEILIAVVQPSMPESILLTTVSADGKASERMLAGVHMDDHLYVSANHWPRFWYYRALANPEVQVTVDGQRASYVAVPVTGDEDARIREAYPFPFFLKFLTGFAPRRFLRLDPR